MKQKKEDENICIIQVKSCVEKNNEVEKPTEANIAIMDKEVTSFVEGCECSDIGKPVVPCSFGITSDYGMSDMGSSINVIPYTLYAKLRDEIYSCGL